MTTRKLVAGIIFGMAVLFAPPSAQASEGRFTLTQGSVVCEGISFWQNREYKISGRCQGLVYPYSEQLTGYVLWAQPEDGTAALRIDDINLGIIEGRMLKKFTSLFVTAEGGATPRQPSDRIVTSGSITPFAFGAGSTAPGTAITPQATQTPRPTMTPTPTPAGRSFNAARLARLTPILIIIGVIVVIVVITAAIWRRA